jgi:hypothetical protein
MQSLQGTSSFLVYVLLFAHGFCLAICLLPLSALRDAMLDPESSVPLNGKALGWLLWLLLTGFALTVVFYPLSWIASLSGTSLIEPIVALAGLLAGGAIAYALNSGCKRLFARAIGSKPASTSVAR